MIFDPVSLRVFGLARNAALERGCKRQFGTHPAQQIIPGQEHAHGHNDTKYGSFASRINTRWDI